MKFEKNLIVTSITVRISDAQDDIDIKIAEDRILDIDLDHIRLYDDYKSYCYITGRRLNESYDEEGLIIPGKISNELFKKIQSIKIDIVKKRKGFNKHIDISPLLKLLESNKG